MHFVRQRFWRHFDITTHAFASLEAVTHFGQRSLKWQFDAWGKGGSALPSPPQTHYRT